MFVGTFLVSLNMYGFQLSVIDVSDNPEWINYIDEETSAFAWAGNHLSISSSTKKRIQENIISSTLDDINSKVNMIVKIISNYNHEWSIIKLILLYSQLLKINIYL
jgi:hypothetical protein